MNQERRHWGIRINKHTYRMLETRYIDLFRVFCFVFCVACVSSLFGLTSILVRIFFFFLYSNRHLFDQSSFASSAAAFELLFIFIRECETTSDINVNGGAHMPTFCYLLPCSHLHLRSYSIISIDQHSFFLLLLLRLSIQFDF